jgi:hypothetical protein
MHRAFGAVDAAAEIWPGSRVALDLSSHAPRVILKLPACPLECVIDGERQFRMAALSHQLTRVADQMRLPQATSKLPDLAEPRLDAEKPSRSHSRPCHFDASVHRSLTCLQNVERLQ